MIIYKFHKFYKQNVNPISAGVVCTPIHVEGEGGGQKCPIHIFDSHIFVASLTPFSTDLSKISHPRCKLPYV